jgi:membrane fusion protein
MLVHDLFRSEVLSARTSAWSGAAVLAPPLSYSLCAGLALLLAAAIVALLVFGEYTRRTRVAGITVPSAGLIKLMAPQPGLIVERRVREGQAVRAGDVLFVLSAERLIDATGRVAGLHGIVAGELQRRRASLQRDALTQHEVARQQYAAATRRLHDLEAEAGQLRREAATLSARAASARAQLERLAGLQSRGFVSELALQQKQDELLDQQARLQALERMRLAVAREQASVAAERAQMPRRAELQHAELERALSAVEQEIATTEASRAIAVVAPQAGVVTAILAEPGQQAGAQALATLLPAGSELEAHLFAPSRAAGFVEPGQAVRVRYAAYPYQKFGQYAGRVVQVSRSALSAGELPAQLAAPAQHGEGFYRIHVQLAANHVVAYGKPQPLAAGMHLDADILQERRRLIEWVFEPLLGLRGAL